MANNIKFIVKYVKYCLNNNETSQIFNAYSVNAHELASVIDECDLRNANRYRYAHVAEYTQ